MAGRIYFARLNEPPAAVGWLAIPDLPRHAALRETGAGDFLFAVCVDGDDPARRVIAAECALAGPPRLDESMQLHAGAPRLISPPRPFPLADAHRFLHDGTRGPADLAGADEGGKIDAALALSRAFLDPARRESVPKIVQFWRWLGRL